MPPIVWKNDRYLIGLTGGIGSGKSAAGRAFADAGAVVVDADLVARDALHSAELRPKLIDAFGEGILGADGEIERPKLASLVFGDEDRRRALNALIHPHVRTEFRRRVEALRSGDVLVYDVPLLFETGAEQDFDLTIVVSANRKLRYERVRERNGWSRKEFEGREQSQMPLAEKEKRADLIISNEGSPEDLQNIVTEIFEHIRAAGPQSSQQQVSS